MRTIGPPPEHRVNFSGVMAKVHVETTADRVMVGMTFDGGRGAKVFKKLTHAETVELIHTLKAAAKQLVNTRQGAKA